MAKKLSADDMKAIHIGLANANLGDYKISVLHLRPKPRSVGAAAVDDGDECHSQELPNGHIVIVCE